MSFPLNVGMVKTGARHDPEQDGEMPQKPLVRRHPGVFLVLCGQEGGLGYLRLFEIQPDGATLRMKTYSPSLGVFATGDTQTGILRIEPALW